MNKNLQKFISRLVLCAGFERGLMKRSSRCSVALQKIARLIRPRYHAELFACKDI